MTATTPLSDICTGRHGRPLSTPLREWWSRQEDILATLLGNEETGNKMGLPRLARILQANPELAADPARARSALAALLIAHGQPSGDVLGFHAGYAPDPPPEGLRGLAKMLLPAALQCADADIADPPPSDLVSACLFAHDPDLLDAALGAAHDPATINGLPWTHYAAITGQDRCLQVLLRHGHDPGQVDPEGNTLLHNASTAQVVVAALDAGVDATKLNHARETPAQAWARRAPDRARVEALLSVFLAAPQASPDPAASFFILAKTNNMGRLKSFARKLGVDYSIRHQGQGLLFYAALRLAHEGMAVNQNSTVPQDARVASNWLGFLLADPGAVAAATDIERSGVASLVAALCRSVHPTGMLSPGPAPEGHLRHAALALVDAFPESKHSYGPSTRVGQGMQKFMAAAIKQAVEANDGRSSTDAARMAHYALFKMASTHYLQDALVEAISAGLVVPPDQRDQLMLAACKSCHASTQAMQGDLAEKGLPSLQRLLYTLGGSLPKSEEYIRSWVNYPSISHAAKKAFEPLLAAVHASAMSAQTPQVPSIPQPRRPRSRF